MSNLKEEISFRRVFCAPKDMVWISADFKSQELRIAAAVSGDVNLNSVYFLEKEYEDGTRPKPLDPNGVPYSDPNVDPHIVASKAMHPDIPFIIQNTPWEAHKDGHPLIVKNRHNGKILNFQLIYGGHANAVATALNINIENSQKLIDLYFSYPNGFYGLGRWLKKTGIFASHERWVRTSVGGMLFCNETNSKGLDDKNTSTRRGCNFAIQGRNCYALSKLR